MMVDIVAALVVGNTVWFAQPDILKGSLVTTLSEVRPTIFLGLPQTWEKFKDKIEVSTSGVTGIKAYMLSKSRVCVLPLSVKGMCFLSCLATPLYLSPSVSFCHYILLFLFFSHFVYLFPSVLSCIGKIFHRLLLCETKFSSIQITGWWAAFCA